MVEVFFGVTLVLAVSTSDCDSDRMGSNPIGHPKENCLVNSAVECLPYKERVGGSIPSQGTSSLDARQVKAQQSYPKDHLR